MIAVRHQSNMQLMLLKNFATGGGFCLWTKLASKATFRVQDAPARHNTATRGRFSIAGLVSTLRTVGQRAAVR